MGIRPVDLNPLQAGGSTPTIMPPKPIKIKAFQVSRSNTTLGKEIVLPAQSSILRVEFFPATASNAGTTATVTLTVKQNGSTISTGTQDVKGAAGSQVLVQMSNLPNLEDRLNGPLADIFVYAQYAETGAASTTGGPWNFVVTYVE